MVQHSLVGYGFYKLEEGYIKIVLSRPSLMCFPVENLEKLFSLTTRKQTQEPSRQKRAYQPISLLAILVVCCITSCKRKSAIFDFGAV